MGRLSIVESSIVEESIREGKEQASATAEPGNRKRFTPPSIEEIDEYCREKGYTHVDSEYFRNYYENTDWKIKGRKMKSWKLAVANWEKRQMEFERSKQPKRQDIAQHEGQTKASDWW